MVWKWAMSQQQLTEDDFTFGNMAKQVSSGFAFVECTSNTHQNEYMDIMLIGSLAMVSIPWRTS